MVSFLKSYFKQRDYIPLVGSFFLMALLAYMQIVMKNEYGHLTPQDHIYNSEAAQQMQGRILFFMLYLILPVFGAAPLLLSLVFFLVRKTEVARGFAWLPLYALPVLFFQDLLSSGSYTILTVLLLSGIALVLYKTGFERFSARFAGAAIVCTGGAVVGVLSRGF